MVVTVHYVGFHPSLIFQGFEQLRLKYPVEKVYLLYDGKQDKYGAVSRRNVARLAEALSFFRPVLVKVNPLSYRSVVSRLYAIMKREEGREVLVDLTDMPPIMASAATVVAMMFPGARLYGVQAEQRGEFIPDPETPEFEDFVEGKDSLSAAGTYVVEAPGERVSLLEGEREERVLVLLHEKKGRAKSITQLIEWLGENPRDPVVKATYSRLVASMEKKGLVRRMREGRSRAVVLTDLGAAVAEALARGEVGRAYTRLLRRPLAAVNL